LTPHGIQLILKITVRNVCSPFLKREIGDVRLVFAKEGFSTINLSQGFSVICVSLTAAAENSRKAKMRVFLKAHQEWMRDNKGF